MTDHWVVSQVGAREHYALARMLAAAGRLHTLYTDLWAGPRLRQLGGIGPAGLRGLVGRHHPDLSDRSVVSFPAAALAGVIRRRPRSREGEYLRYLADGQGFARRVAHRLAKLPVAERPAGLVGYDTACLEAQEVVAGWGRPTVVDQIDPAGVEEDIVQEECRRWPGWQAVPGRIPDAYLERLAAEWRRADRVLVNSDWSREALVRQGVPADKLVVVPLSYDPPTGLTRGHTPGSRPRLTVLWLGQVVLRKGIPYLLDAARELLPLPVDVLVAGPVGVSPVAIGSAPANVRFLGPVPRTEAARLFREADVFVLPTLSDGFALTQLEAMAHGLPVVVTPNCGRVVTDGVDGRVLPAADAAALAAALAALEADRRRVAEMSQAATYTAARYTLAAVADRFLSSLPSPDRRTMP